MPVEMGIWRIDAAPERVVFSKLPLEERLEVILEQSIDVLGLDVLLIGRQVLTAFGKRIDLMAIDADGDVYAIELKRDRTPREVVAQVLDYGSWVQALGYEDVTELFSSYSKAEEFDSAFEARFGTPPPDSLNESQRLVIVSSELDASTERIVGYLSTAFGVPINAVFFRYFADDDREYLARTWLIDPHVAETSAVASPARKKTKKPWNGQDFFVALGEDNGYRSWEDARKYGFVSAGQAPWFSGRLHSLFPGAQISVYIPKVGYVGVGRVVEEAVPIKDFEVEIDGQEIPILDAPDLVAPKMASNADDAELSEHLVRVEWISTVARQDALKEPGLFANQNIVCKLTDPKTLDRIHETFLVDQE